MSPEEESEFFTFGCASRSIIKLCELRGMPISADDFVDRFKDKFPDGQFGLLSVDKVCDVVRELGLCNSVSAIRDTDLAAKPSLGTFVLTDKDHTGNHIFHFRLFLAVGSGVDKASGSTIPAFRLYNVFQDGSETEEWVPLPQLETQLCHFLVLQP